MCFSYIEGSTWGEFRKLQFLLTTWPLLTGRYFKVRIPPLTAVAAKDSVLLRVPPLRQHLAANYTKRTPLLGLLRYTPMDYEQRIGFTCDSRNVFLVTVELKVCSWGKGKTLQCSNLWCIIIVFVIIVKGRMRPCLHGTVAINGPISSPQMIREYRFILIAVAALLRLESSNTGMVGSNPSRRMDACPPLSVSCCPVYVRMVSVKEGLPCF